MTPSNTSVYLHNETYEDKYVQQADPWLLGWEPCLLFVSTWKLWKIAKTYTQIHNTILFYI